MDLDELPGSVNELTLAYREHRLSPVEVTQALLDQAERSQPTLNAFITITAESALTQARAAERRLLLGEATPLLGVPITLKDVYDQRGVPTTAGSSIWRDSLAHSDALVVQRLFCAGAISLGKTNMHELAYGSTSINRHFGPVRNPWNLDCIAGGSSGGAGAAVAARIGWAGLGSDTAGSIRMPAALCGVVGFKPTYGRVPMTGVLPLMPSLDHVGPLTRCVSDAATVLEVIAGYAASDPNCAYQAVDDYVGVLGKTLSGVRIGLIERQLADASSDVARAVEAASERLISSGARLQTVLWPNLPDLKREMAAEATANHLKILQAKPDCLGADVRERLRDGLDIRAVAYITSLKTLHRLRLEIESMFDTVDVVLGPTVPRGAPGFAEVAAGGRISLAQFTRPYNLTGLPVITIPCGFTDSGLPIGLQIAGKHFDEAMVLRVAYAYEQQTDWHLRKPPEANLAGIAR